ncbi:MAG: ABC transporter ATP-binding protein [Pollutimonas bauzanensis]
MQVLLQIENLTVSYGRVLALNDVSLSVGAGELVGVIGANCAGKTTLLRAISGLAQVRRGHIDFDGSPVDKLPASHRPALGIAHVPEGRQVFPRLTVEENLILGAVTRASRPGRADRIERVYAMFPRLAERRAQNAGTLSGGEQQMLAIGRALMLEPRLLLLDEPSMGLAPIIVDEVYTKIREIQASGLAILLVEQNVSMALGVISRAYVLERGSVALAGSAADLDANPEVRRAFLGL